MSKLALKIVEAIQHSMLDRLFIRLMPLVWVVSIADDRWESVSPYLMLVLLVVLASIVALAWLVGAVANKAPTRRNPPPSNGFEAWAPMPPEDLKPPQMMRAIVFGLSLRKPSSLAAVFGYIAFMAAVCLTWALSLDPAPAWILSLPGLTDPAAQDVAWWSAAGICVVMVITSWAAEQRNRLEPPSVTDRLDHDWGGVAILVIFLLGMAFMTWTMWDVARWPLMFIGAVLLPVIIVPGWRRGLMDAVFGKRNDPFEQRLDRR